ncbi:acetyl/propionyl/methylcrotonyl-CoA carboxylase subunit alpha [Euzebya tangerina]|uniref:acetyl/propionyl/methylcrotonyl-CoA carboxylase subunit alpha n=1 Tax=Euzebya tangerina TaxID=591198 RepID=UPI000E31335F|nr:acetyl-CoA carboxylase biotin carboxylase subunit [Euzebya tangerina]
MFSSVLVANRGEIAIRVIRACKELGVTAVAVYAEADADAPHVRAADAAYLIGPTPPAASYLHPERIIGAAREAGAEAIHPGYGFLSENADFARAVVDAGLVFVGPPPSAIQQMGDKLSARAVADAAGVPVVPGTRSPVGSTDEALAFSEQHGYPVAVKAAFGGGGRGLKVVQKPEAMEEAIGAAQREAVGAFGRGECYLERYLARPRHVEIQVLADADGTTIYLGDRDCSLQRRHQKLVEEAPAPGIASEVREAMGQAAIRVAREMGYTNAGTCEFLLDEDGQTFYFLEMNTRLQVEHPVTELVTGVDLVHQQLRIAAGDGMTVTQDDITTSGHAIEVRLNAEEPAAGFMPSPGTITELRIPTGPWVRFDTGVEAGYQIPPAYDSLIGKLIVWGADRDLARLRMARALDELVVGGVPTTAPFHELAMTHPQFAEATHCTASVEREWDLSELPEHQHPGGDGATTSTPGGGHGTEHATAVRTKRDVRLTIGGQPRWVSVYGTADSPAAVAGAARTGETTAREADRAATDGPEVRAPMQGTIVAYAAEPGEAVTAGQLVVVLEAMKMETHVAAHRDGTVQGVGLAVGDVVERGAVLATITDG